ncbi:ABC transporter permease [Pelagibaculum spongiae]|uniref:Transport permease protein n=1 Tax=Pelagibaculum spongiae TaxID=2080658 RepID=A0A2V1GX71_9GAMM|nr:ABC transporter permease [Pelagibaculum spongiae]PVZ70253.1 polysialic acid transporter [Pelagibaculum spongiae]
MSRTPFQIQRAVVHALFMREMKTRFGSMRMGYAWVLLEPLMHIGVMTAMFSLRGSSQVMGVDTPYIIMTGIGPFLFFSKLFSLGFGAIEGNRSLFVYRQVRPINTFVARFIMELMLFVIGIPLITAILWFCGYQFPLGNILEAILAWVLLFIFSFGLSLVAGCIGYRSRDLTSIAGVIQRPLYFISGIFFSLSMLPESVWPYLLWNPILHAIELGREGLFETYSAPMVSMNYLAFCALASVTIGLMLYRLDWRNMVAS